METMLLGFSQFSKYRNVDSERFLLGGSNANTNVIVDDMSTMTIGRKLGSSFPMMEIRRLSIYIGKETTNLWSLIMTLKVCEEEIDASDCGPEDVPATPLVNALRFDQTSKYEPLKELHKAIKQCETALVSENGDYSGGLKGKEREEARIEKEVEANQKRIKKDLEKQHVLRRKGLLTPKTVKWPQRKK
ncbi:hypothetical protein Tco_1277408, partial [Tanacetum coccineum]